MYLTHVETGVDVENLTPPKEVRSICKNQKYRTVVEDIDLQTLIFFKGSGW